ncbi:hypothetical protein BGZ58_000719 [Dissophora ornata]|nr:hypothetical protein BGZ58_000719 [Dissophora ornata]
MGWAFNQFQAWARSSFTVPSSDSCHDNSLDGLCSVTIQCENVGDFYIDNERLSGDWYGYGLTRHTFRLAPNSRHTISVRVVHEIRIFGGVTLPPPSKFRCELKVPEGQGRAMVQVVKEGYGGYVTMDAVDNVLAGEYVSVALRNVGPERVLVKSVRVAHGSDQFRAVLKDPSKTISLFPSTHRPLAIRLEKFGRHSGSLDFSLQFDLETVATNSESVALRGILETDVINIEQRTWGEVYKYTFLDFDGTVHYAAAIPPSDPSSQPTNSAPVLVALHGAGVEVAQSPFWLSEYKQRERTWIVLPTGRSPWGYDWHGASIKNVMYAIQNLADTLPGVPESLKNLPGMKPDPERLFMAGHSNGGQGAWYFATHFPDKAIAATPAAGYVNIKQYVPFFGWISNSYTDAHLRGVGIPILARTGGVDDNVPPFNSRKMVRLGQENAHNLSAISLSEIPGGGHWFDGILNDEAMQTFLKQHLHDDTISRTDGISVMRERVKAAVHPQFPRTFDITLTSPAGMGSKGGIQIEQLRVPFRKATIKVYIQDIRQDNDDDVASTAWVLRTTNIRRFRFLDSPSLRARRGNISRLVIDGATFNLSGISEKDLSLGTFIRVDASKGSSQWEFASSNEWVVTERHRETYGPSIQVLEKRVVVVLGTRFANSMKLSNAADRIAKLVAHDIYLYGRGDVEVLTDEEYLEQINGFELREHCDRMNLVLIGDSHQNSVTKRVLAQTDQEVVIDSQEGVVSIQPTSDMGMATEFREPGTGLLMIRPWGSSNLAMVIAGLDAQGLETAARLFPKRTGLLVPEWVVTGPEMPWKGAGGILAAGYWGNHWEYQPLMSA